MGYPEQSRQQSREAVAWARELAYDPSIANTLVFASIADEFRGDFQVLHERAEKLVALSTQQSMSVFLGAGIFTALVDKMAMLIRIIE